MSDAQIFWNIAKDGNNITIYVDGTTDEWLYSTNANNGVRVGDNTNKTWVIDEESGYLKHVGTSRFMGVYNSSDWRAYTSVNDNIKGQTLAFYVLSKGTPTALTNTAVETKAVKTLRNGILVIEKAGVKYNAQGAVIR